MSRTPKAETETKPEPTPAISTTVLFPNETGLANTETDGGPDAISTTVFFPAPGGDDGAGVEPPAEPASRFSVAQAYQHLGVTPAHRWQEIEQIRRDIVQLAHPHRVAALSPQRRSAAERTARDANSAYLVLARHRQTS